MANTHAINKVLELKSKSKDNKLENRSYIQIDFSEINLNTMLSKEDLYSKFSTFKSFFDGLYFSLNNNKLATNIKDLLYRNSNYKYDILTNLLCLNNIGYNELTQIKNNYSKIYKNLDTTMVSLNENQFCIEVNLDITEIFEYLKVNFFIILDC